MHQCWFLRSRLFGLICLILGAAFCVRSVSSFVQSPIDPVALKQDVETLFGEGQFEKFYEKFKKFLKSDDQVLPYIADIVDFQKRDLEDLRKWEAGEETPPDWWKPGYLTRWWPAYDPTHPTCGGWGDYLFEEEDPEFQAQVKAFLKECQQAIRENDKQAFAKFFSFPTFWDQGHDNQIFGLYKPEDILKNYDLLMAPKMRETFLALTLKDVRIFRANSNKFICIKEGVLWLQCEMKIYAVGPISIWKIRYSEDTQILGSTNPLHNDS